MWMSECFVKLGIMKDNITYWKVKVLPFKARTYEDAKKKAENLLQIIQGKSKRKFHVRARYFAKQKVFFDYFWFHIIQKPIAQRKSRLRLLPCAIELIEQSTFYPTAKINPDKKSETLFRLYGKTSFDEVFVVQIKQTKKRSLQFMSVFPY